MRQQTGVVRCTMLEMLNDFEHTRRDISKIMEKHNHVDDIPIPNVSWDIIHQKAERDVCFGMLFQNISLSLEGVEWIAVDTIYE